MNRASTNRRKITRPGAFERRGSQNIRKKKSTFLTKKVSDFRMLWREEKKGTDLGTSIAFFSMDRR